MPSELFGIITFNLERSASTNARQKNRKAGDERRFEWKSGYKHARQTNRLPESANHGLSPRFLTRGGRARGTQFVPLYGRIIRATATYFLSLLPSAIEFCEQVVRARCDLVNFCFFVPYKGWLGFWQSAPACGAFMKSRIRKDRSEEEVQTVGSH